MCTCEAHRKHDVRCTCHCTEHEHIRRHYAELDEWDRAHSRHGETGTTGKVIDPEGVNHPKHYNEHPSGVECIEVVRHMSFNLGNAIKYLWRDGIKDEEMPLQDLKKAAWYLNDEIQRREGNE